MGATLDRFAGVQSVSAQAGLTEFVRYVDVWPSKPSWFVDRIPAVERTGSNHCLLISRLSVMSTDRPASAKRVVSRDPDVLSGELVFAGTRALVQTLIDYLKAGETLDWFLEGFPTVEREQAEAYLEMTPKDAETHA
jgi:uncharacterized protein (DUF433 family)